VLCSSCGNGTKATFKNEADTLVYEVGMADAQQMMQMIIRSGADSANFVKGFLEGYKADTSKATQAYYQGYMTGMQARAQMVPMLEAQLFGDDSTQSVRAENYAAGIVSALKNKTQLKVGDHLIGPEEAFADAQTRLQKYQEKQLAKEYAAEKKAGEDFIAKKHAEAGMNDLENGVFYKEISKGTGAAVESEDLIVDYTYELRLSNDSVFDSSAKHASGKPVSVPLKRAPLMKGLKQAIAKMHVGDEWEVYIPASEAYGAQGYRGVVPPFSAIVAKVKLLATHEAPAPKTPAAKPADLQNKLKK